MSEQPNNYMDNIERIAAEAEKGRIEPEPIDFLEISVTLAEDDCETPIRVWFGRDLGDTWSVHIGPGFYLAVNNPQQGVVISRLVELIAAQRRSIIFGRDGTERDRD